MVNSMTIRYNFQHLVMNCSREARAIRTLAYEGIKPSENALFRLVLVRFSWRRGHFETNWNWFGKPKSITGLDTETGL